MINIFLLIISLLSSFSHPFHVSVCDIDFSQASKSIQVSQRVFIDDLEKVLSKKYQINLIIDDKSQAAVRDSLIEAYIFENLQLLVDGKSKKRVYIGNEIEEDGMWCYIEYEGVKKFSSLEVRSTVFLETFEDQANIIHFKYNDYEKSIKLDFAKKSGTFSRPKN